MFIPSGLTMKEYDLYASNNLIDDIISHTPVNKIDDLKLNSY